MENFPKAEFYTNYSAPTFLDKIKTCLQTCSEFYFSVSFIKKAGLVLIAPYLQAAIERGAKGKLITTTYQNFTDIESLKWFLSLSSSHKNFECKLDYDCFYDEKNYTKYGFHSKGYLFLFGKEAEIVIGSSNITRFALLKNIEWDLVVKSAKGKELLNVTMQEFDTLWNKTKSLNVELIQKYANQIDFAIERWDMDYDLSAHDIKPNYMQRKALRELNRYRAIGEGKALIVAATGSGKTYLAAFDALNFSPQRLLYVVHEGSILQKSYETFQKVFGNQVSMGFLTGTRKDTEAQFLFATNRSINSALQLYAPNEFDYIIIDECHHAAAQTYKNIINYFKPEFLLGLTATPERMDNEDVFGMFGNNIPFELRLRDALINDLIVPFHYYGISDKLVDYGLNKNQEYKMIAQLVTDEHCDFVSEQIEKNRIKEQKLKAIAFCRNTSHARMMSEAMATKGYKTAYLTGKNDIGERIRAYEDLQSDREGSLEILCTVDILNEGVDIPSLNMVLFLRPTESSTIFIQQLGRGLRKFSGKTYVPVLDFIGNSYKRSVQIAFALGSLSKNFVIEKQLLISLVKDNFKPLQLEQYGVKINIDNLAKEDILKYIESENFYSLNYMKQDYQNFKNFINSASYPQHIDFLNNDYAPDLLKFMKIKIDGRETGSYYMFLKGINENDLPLFDDKQIRVIAGLSKLLPLVRKEEYIIAQKLIEGSSSITDAPLQHALQCLINDGIVSTQTDEKQILNADLNKEFIDYLNDLINYGLTRYDSEYDDCASDFLLWHGYRIDQVQRKLNKNPGYNAKGTYVYEDKVYIFASIKKDISDTEKQHLNYKDKFLESDKFQWECEAGLNENNQQKLKDSKEAYLFIRKISDEHGIVQPFIYVGTGILQNPRETNNIKGSLLFDIHMKEQLPDYLQYDFGLTSDLS